MARSQNTGRRKLDNMPYVVTMDGTQRIALTTMGSLGSSLVSNFSYGIWLRTTNKATTASYMLGTSNSTGGNYFFSGITRASTKVGMVNFQFRDDTGGRVLSGDYTAKRLNDGMWHHLVVTKTSANNIAGTLMYVDGEAVSYTTVTDAGYTDPINFNRALSVGSSLGSGAVAGGWIGSLSRPYFYQRILTPTEVSDWYYKRTVPTGEFAGYPCTEGSGTSVADSIGVHTGTLTSAAQWSTDTPYKSRAQRSL